MAAQDEGQGRQHEGHVDQGVTASSSDGQVAFTPTVVTHERLLEILDDIRDRVARGDSFEGHIEWMIPEEEPGHAVLSGTFAVRASYRIGNLQGQGGMRMIGSMTTGPEAARAASDRCTDWCRQQGSRGHYATSDDDKARMSYSMGDGLFEDGVIPRKWFPHVAETLYREGFGYNAIADWAGYSHEEGMLAITGQLAHWAQEK